MQVIAFGSVFLEIVFGHIDALPRPGEEIYTEEFAISCGGAVTVASAARRQGASAGLATLLGRDLGSTVVEQFCQREGVDLSCSRRVPGRAAGITVVLNFDGDRAFISHLPEREPEEAFPESWLEPLERERPEWCYVHAVAGHAGFLRRARELGCRLAVDVSLGAVETTPEEVVECVRLAEVFVPNEGELRILTGAASLEAALATARTWCPKVVVKRGGQGAVVATSEGTAEVTEGLAPVAVRDRTGAGDAFAGAMIAALVAGAGLREAAVAGNAAGSEAVGRLGAVGEVEVEGLSGAWGPVGAALAAWGGAPGGARPGSSER